jgi:hypothetical protein
MGYTWATSRGVKGYIATVAAKSLIVIGFIRDQVGSNVLIIKEIL